ncbi:MAG: hypothetical protein WA130_03870 [Candidatus Methanoperedens sp.]
MVWFFAHARLDPASEECPLRTKEGLEDLLQRFRMSDVEKSESKKQIRLVLSPNPYTKTVRLYGILPVLRWGDFTNPVEVNDALNSLIFHGVGIKSSPQSRIFHPSEPEAKIELDPNADKYELIIDTQNLRYKSLDLIGNWKAEPISVKDIFSGEPNRVERRSNDTRVKNGDTLFFVLKEDFQEKIEGCENLVLGTWKIIKFEVNDRNKKLVNRFIEVSADTDNFYVDIILPPYATPNSESPISGKPESEALIAVIPPRDRDPEFEIVSVPLGKENKILPSKGKGVPRIFVTRFPIKGSSRLSVHWGNEHRVINFHAESEKKSLQNPWIEDVELGLELRTDGKIRKINPWSIEGAIPIESKKVKENRIDLNLIGPKEFKIDIIGTFSEESEYKGLIRKWDTALEEAESIIDSWIKEDCNRIILDYDSLGRIELDILQSKPWQKKLPDREIERRLKNLDEIPKKATWSVVRKVYGVPLGTSHDELPDRAKKQVRLTLMKIKKEK